MVTCALVLTLALPVFGPVASAGAKTHPLMKFATNMAKRGNWREAHFRWRKAADRDPDNPHILNNLAVSYEALGEKETASGLYKRALARSGGNSTIRANAERFERFWRHAGEPTEAQSSAGQPASNNGTPPQKPKSKGKTIRVNIDLPIAPRLELSGSESVLVTSFLTDESSLLDTNREMVRFVRSEYRKSSSLNILDVTPPPAIPEQTIEDLLANVEFWKHLGREYQADLVVSGAMTYGRRDYSGFRDVDEVSPTTGQKVRRSRFVEQEQFTYTLDVFFMDGATGTLRLRDRLQRSIVFRGSQNDPISAFYEMSESLAPDLLAVVKQQTRQETRVIFKY